MTICQIKTFTRPTVYTVCGLTVTLAEASGWHSDVTCRWCLTHTVRSGEHDDSMHAILAGQ